MWELVFSKTLLGLWTLFNIIVSAWVAFNFNKRLKRFYLRFSFFSELQLKSLVTAYHLLVEFKDKTNIMEELESKNRTPEMYKRKSVDWLESYIHCTKHFSKERYVFPIHIRKEYDEILKDFYSLYTVIEKKQKIENLFYIDETGNRELGGDFIDLVDLSNELKEFNVKGVFNKSVISIESLLCKIEEEFDKIK